MNTMNILMNFLITVWNKDFFTWPAITMEKQKSLLTKTRDLCLGGGHFNLCMLSGLCLFCSSNQMKLPFPDDFGELLFLYAFLILPKSVSSSHQWTNTYHVEVLHSPNQISSKWILNPGQDWHEMQICN